MKTTFSEKIIEKFNYGDNDLKNYEKILDNYKNKIECRGIFCSDFSEFKKTISFFLNKSKQKEAFYIQLIHDIKSPILSVELAIRNSNGNYPIEDIYNINSSILELINNTLVLHTQRDKKENIELLKMLENVIENHKFLIQDKELNFEIKVNMNLKTASYPCYIERIFSNLVFNAIKYSPNNSIIRIYQKGKNVLCFKNAVSNNFTERGYGLGLKIIEELCRKSNISFYKRKFLNTITFCLKFQNMS